jgi:MFS family permease
MYSFPKLSAEQRQYLIVTGNYWAFTLTDGALRMLVVLYFNQIGYSPLEVAMLFLFYELFGVITNLVGGWLGARVGLNRIMNIGLGIQILALSMLLVPTPMLTVLWVMIAQALSGIAKDLNKMSAKSAIKSLVPPDAPSQLFKWVAILTGSKNALKGVGFFLGGLLLAALGFTGAVLLMTLSLSLVWLASLFLLKSERQITLGKPKFTEVLSKSKSINLLSAARMFLFAARDVWFVVALPVYMAINLDWQHTTIGTFFAVWIIGYGVIQSIAPKLVAKDATLYGNQTSALHWIIGLTFITALISVGFLLQLGTTAWLVMGLLLFGCVFAVNSSLHSYLIVRLANADNTSMDVGFYYMANAMGRLTGTVFSGWLFGLYGLSACLIASTGFLVIGSMLTHRLVRHTNP